MLNCSCLKSFAPTYFKFTDLLEKYFFSFLLFFMRIWIAKIFFLSGLNKISDWQTTVFLFEYEYKTPFLPAKISALMATITELTMPILLFFGIMSRFAALPLLIMTLVIQFTYLNMIDHLYWAIICMTIIFYGPGRYSIDYMVKQYFFKKYLI